MARPLQLRLLDPLTSHGSKAGASFRAVVTAPYEKDGQVRLPAGTMVRGAVTRAHRVGIGFVHERASLSLEFREYELPDGRRFSIAARLMRVDNARETVGPSGEVQGILAANNPQSLIHGIWRTPNPTLFQRSFMGLTGAGGRIFTEYQMGPIGAAVLFAARLALFRMPEPEIRLPAGAELLVEVQNIPSDAPAFEVPAAQPVEAAVAEQILAEPSAIKRIDGRTANDLINIAFLGSKQELLNAFAAAGWSEAERFSARSFSRAWHAYTHQCGYPTAPVSKLLYKGAEPDYVFEKSLNTIAKRHHVRIWSAGGAGRNIWLGAATHDIGIAFNPSAVTFSHKIHPGIDFERSKVASDLEFAGCSEPARYIERPAARTRTVQPGGVVTDGRMAVLALQDCAGAAAVPPMLKPPQTAFGRIARRVVLEGRNYVIRGNPYYWGYRAIRWRPARTARSVAVEE